MEGRDRTPFGVRTSYLHNHDHHPWLDGLKWRWRENHQPRAESQQIVPNGTLLSTTPRQVLESSTGDSRLWYRQRVCSLIKDRRVLALVWPDPDTLQGCVELNGWLERGRKSKFLMNHPPYYIYDGSNTTRTNKLSSVTVTRRASTLEAFRYESTDVASWHWPFDQPLNHMSGPAVPLVLSGTSVVTPN